ncbi:MAG: hypothetical protein PVG77_05645, partial [Nitrosopumilaceae archaeon]
KLISNATKIVEGSKKIETASNFTLFLKKVYINKGHEGNLKFWEGKNTNDLLITTSFQVGTNPIVQRVHKYSPNRKIGFSNDFFKSIVCSFEDFTNNHITIKSQIFDVDSYRDFKDNLNDFTKLIGESGFFPVVSSFVSIGSTISNSFFSLLEKLDSHDAIIDENLKLEMTEENTGSKILQTGHWVCFSEPQEDGLQLDYNLKVLEDEVKEFDKCSYVVFTIRSTFDEEPEWQITQKLATLLSELNGKGESGKPAISFLRDTMKGYSNFKKLRRIKALEKKQTKNALNKSEILLLDKLKSDPELKDYL